LASGMTLNSRGQLIVGNLARDGAAKHPHVPEITHSMRNRTSEQSLVKGFGHPLDDEPLEKHFLNGRSAPIHDGMVSKTRSQRGTDKGNDHASVILREAGRLCKPE